MTAARRPPDTRSAGPRSLGDAYRAVLDGIAARLTRRESFGIPLVGLCAVYSVTQASGLGARISTGVLFALAEVGILLARRLPRRAGFAIVVVALAAGLGAMVASPSGLSEVPVLVLAGLIPTVTDGHLRLLSVVAASVAFGAVVWAIGGGPIGLLAGAGVWFLAERTLEQRELALERDRAVALLAEVEASRDDQARAAAGEERSRIARDMHDVLAHSLAGLSLQLQAVRAVAASEGVGPEVTGPLDRAASLAREGVDEARAAVGVLRAADDLGVEDLDRLISRFPGQARLAVTGEPGRLDSLAGHAVYRAVQESLTNAARYATGSQVTVQLAWSPATLGVRIADTGLPSGHEASGIKGSGSGLHGMAERVGAAGGSVQAGPADGGWVVDVRVPTGGPAGRSASSPPVPPSSVPPAPPVPPSLSTDLSQEDP